MTFLWPELLWLLVLVPVIVGVYLLLLRRKHRLAVRYASLAMIRDAIGAGGRLRRHVPPLLFLIATSISVSAIRNRSGGTWRRSRPPAPIASRIIARLA